MALGGLRRPQFHKGQYGSALGSYAPAAQLLAQAGRTQGAAMAGLGGNIGGAIEKYQLNKQERAKIMGRLDRYLTPQKRTDLVSTGVEEVDKKRQSTLDKLDDGGGSMRDLQFMDSLISTDIEMENQAAKQRAAAQLAQMNKVNLGYKKQIMGLATKAQKDQEFINQSLLDELRETRSTMDTLTEEERAGFIDAVPGRRAWLERLSPLLERGAVPVSQATFNPRQFAEEESSRLTRERQERADVAEEKEFPPEERARLEKKKLKGDIRYKEGLLSISAVNAISKANPSKRIEGLSADIDKLLSGPAFMQGADDKPLKIEDVVDYDPISGDFVASEDASRFAATDIQRLKEMVRERYDLQLRTDYTYVDKNGTKQSMPLGDFLREKARRDEAQRKEEERRAQASRFTPSVIGRNAGQYGTGVAP